MEDKFNIQDYLANGVEYITKEAIRTSIKNPKETMFLLKFARNAKKSTKIRQEYAKKDQNIPAFLIASVTSSCNLHCSGCYSRANSSCSDDEPVAQLSGNDWKDIFAQAKAIGISFIVLAGGEPLLREDIIQKATDFPEILFPIFTNGTMIDDEYLKLFDDNRNLVPIISMEGNEQVTDSRRGEGIYKNVMNTMDAMRKKNIIFGSSLTFTKNNVSSLVSNEYIDMLHDMGCKVVFFIEYVPVNPETVNMAPSDEEREILLENIDRLRKEYDDMLFMSFPGDEKGSGGCLAAGRGFFHINSHGGAEPCPASPYSDINVKDTSILEALNSKLFKSLRDGGILMGEHEGGCVLFEHQSEVEKLLEN
ncbi:radical SAM/SPASM domain-containing protein [Methanobrevibacter sp.]|uniref:radical SAM/SPASM domain-containing protein n=1 Tax=Methanobrevibacter sp. TaxID=66852 RepID=UPI0026E05D3E|nr:radical SAM protein [Methanobrevibacter sp.]MDO5860642.1 radical SAM protein [Methanobrevibacter sp.]